MSSKILICVNFDINRYIFISPSCALANVHLFPFFYFLDVFCQNMQKCH